MRPVEVNVPRLTGRRIMSGHYVTIFRSRPRPGIEEEYSALSARMLQIAESMPGFVSIDSFYNDTGERVSIVEFESHETAAAWRKHPEHLEAQRIGRERLYAEYHGLVCTVERTYEFSADVPTHVS